MITVEMQIGEPLPEGCACTWQYHPKKGTKTIKVFHANCEIPDHKIAYRDSHVEVPVLAEVVPVKRGKGRPKNLEGQWHKKTSA